jgi:hypothetical protein
MMMKQIETRTMIRTALAVLVLVAAVPVLGQVEFTFEGYSKSTLGPDVVGTAYTVLGIANPAVSAPTPLAMDFANNQYTIRVTGLTLAAFAEDVVLGVKTYAFNGGLIEIFEDAKAGGTAADYAAEATFVDGTMLLQATVDPGWEMRMDNPPPGLFGYSGNGIGACDLTGGSELAMLIGMGFTTDNWSFAGTGIAEPGFIVTVPAGYDLTFGTKIIYPFDPTPTVDSSWGEVKNLFR